MSRVTRLHLMIWGPLMALTLMSACEQARFRDRAGPGQPPLMRPEAMRALVSPGGLASMYAAASPGGIVLDAEAQFTELGDGEVRLGPLNQTVTVEDWEVFPAEGHLDVGVSLRQPSVPVPVRIYDGVGYQICRFVVTAATADIAASISLASSSGQLWSADAVEVELDEVRVQTVGSCDVLEPTAGDDEAMRGILVGYVRGAFGAAITRALDASPLDGMGLMHRPVEVGRVSAFENRRGRVFLASQVSPEVPLELSEQGLSLGMDVGISQHRASCAPSFSEESVPRQGAEPIAADALERFEADVAMALSTSMLERLTQAMTSAGFACLGLEDVRPAEENVEFIPIDDLLLSDIDLNGLPVGSWARISMVPGASPRIEARPQLNDIKLSWDDLTFEVYAEIHTVPVRILKLTTSVELGIRPRPDLPGYIGFDLDNIIVQEASLHSDWQSSAPRSINLMRWTRRLLLLYLGERFVLPLPLEPGTPLTLVGSQIRPHDLVLLLRFTS